MLSFKEHIKAALLMLKMPASQAISYNFDSYMLTEVQPGQLLVLEVDERLVLSNLVFLCLSVKFFVCQPQRSEATGAMEPWRPTGAFVPKPGECTGCPQVSL